MPVYGYGGNAWDEGTPSGLAIDAWGNAVPTSVPRYVAMIQTINGSEHYVWRDNPNFRPTVEQVPNSSSPSNLSPQYQFTFDTIGQSIYRTMGHCRLPLRIIWAQGIDTSGQGTTSSTISFAAALCAPIDPSEEGSVVGIFSGGGALFDSSGVIVPDGMDSGVAAMLNASISNAIVYPGDEAQEPAPLIVADRGADVTNAFRGIRYIIFPDWPLAAGSPSALSLQWERTNGDYAVSGAVTFEAV